MAPRPGRRRFARDLHAVEVQFEQERVSQAELRAPIAGIVVTRKVEERAGTMLKPGEAFCEIVEGDRMAAEMSVPEADLGLVRTGRRVALKLNAFPTSTFAGTVERIGEETRAEAGEQYFLVRAVFDNSGGGARDGMVGRARIRAGRRVVRERLVSRGLRSFARPVPLGLAGNLGLAAVREKDEYDNARDAFLWSRTGLDRLGLRRFIGRFTGPCRVN